ncbi:MAG: radical SAM protein [Alistipes sp.]|jgi:wyosine [tRNA(Phe)-imidazoG37] synthetase (radical SAM superfamily)|nr:radical SAM protein [Alistipes sp.]
MTALFSDVIFGPVRSRRLGLSLGVNLLPLDSKLCNFNCIYCECGWNGAGGRNADGGLSVENTPARFNSRADVRRLLEEKLRAMASAGECPDVITFAGNGEPTTHPEFEAVIDDTIALRDRVCPTARVSVLSNATMIGRESVRRALERVDNNILKLDSAFDDTVRLINGSQGAYSVAGVVENMRRFEGRLTVQTMFLRGEYDGHRVDNTTEREVAAWLELVRQIAPRSVMIYTIDRDTPAPDLEKVSTAELRAIADRVEALGIAVSVAG